MISNRQLFDESTDWLAFLRSAANRPAAAHGLRDDLETPIALSALASDCEGTPLEEALADAALKLIESGTRLEMDTVRRLPYEKAPNAFDRLLRALETTPDRFAHEGWRASVFWKLFQMKPDDQHLRSALSRQLKDLAKQYLS